MDGDKVYALGAKGGLICANVGDGKVNWRVEMVKDLGGKVPGWGYTESVLVEGDLVICTPGGKRGTLAALDKKTGEVIWRSSDWTDGAQYASVVPAELNGQRQFVQLTQKTLARCFRPRWVDPVAQRLAWAHGSHSHADRPSKRGLHLLGIRCRLPEDHRWRRQ